LSLLGAGGIGSRARVLGKMESSVFGFPSRQVPVFIAIFAAGVQRSWRYVKRKQQIAGLGCFWVRGWGGR